MRSLYFRIWLTVVAALGLFALASGWVVQRHMSQERVRVESAAQSRVEAWADLLQRSLPAPDAPAAEQAAALRDWSQRLRLPMALDDAQGRRIGASDAYLRRQADSAPGLRPGVAVRLDDGRTLWVTRGNPNRPERGAAGGGGGMGTGMGMGAGPRGGDDRRGEAPALLMPPGARHMVLLPGLPGLPDGAGIVALLALLFLAVAGGAYPVVRGLTRRLEALKKGVEAFGGGALSQRVAEDGNDEVAALATSFNQAAGRIETLLRSHQSLLANASHELRSPLARLQMAVSMLDDAAPAQREKLRQEIHTNIAELDALVEEVLLASRLDAAKENLRRAPVDLLVIAAEEAAASKSAEVANVEGQPLLVPVDERLVRRALRNLIENAHRYAGGQVDLRVRRVAGAAEIEVCDRGPGVPEAYRERIFEAFFRLPGHAEREGGVGLGLALVRQIANAHGGSVRCVPRPGGGSCFILTLPA